MKAPNKTSAETNARIYEIVRKRVIDFDLRPDERINEYKLAEEFGVSRTPIREILTRLEAEGFLSFERNRGFIFRSLDIEEIVDFFQLRAIIECGAFEITVRTASDEDIASLVQFVENEFVDQDKQTPDQALELDEAFHLRMARLAGNSALLSQLEMINARIRFARRTKIAFGPLQKTQRDEHHEIAYALKARDIDTGLRLLNAHINVSITDARLALQEMLLKTFQKARA